MGTLEPHVTPLISDCCRQSAFSALLREEVDFLQDPAKQAETLVREAMESWIVAFDDVVAKKSQDFVRETLLPERYLEHVELDLSSVAESVRALVQRAQSLDVPTQVLSDSAKAAGRYAWVSHQDGDLRRGANDDEEVFLLGEPIGKVPVKISLSGIQIPNEYGAPLTGADLLKILDSPTGDLVVDKVFRAKILGDSVVCTVVIEDHPAFLVQPAKLARLLQLPVPDEISE